MAFEAKIIADSICNGSRLTTMQLTHPRIIHAEVNTHCAFARNASSSRAIPFAVTVKRVIEDPFIPVYWGENQSGMQAAKEIADWKKEKAIKLWLEARDHMIRIAGILAAKECPTCKGSGSVREIRPLQEIDLYDDGGIVSSPNYKTFPCSDCNGTGEGINLHKQIANRLTETWAWITVCVTGDAGAWSNYFALRCHPDAQPEIQKQAYMAQKAYFDATPNELVAGQWHTPYIKPEEYEEIGVWLAKKTSVGEAVYTDTAVDNLLNFENQINDAIVKISTGRCGRTSYLTQEGVRDFAEDTKLHDRLVYHTPLHASPLEHVCQAMGDNQRYAKYNGWKSYRHFIPNEYVEDFQPNHPDYMTVI